MNNTDNHNSRIPGKNSEPQQQGNEAANQHPEPNGAHNSAPGNKHGLHDGNSEPDDTISEPGNENTETFEINGNWNALSKKLKAKFPQLTDADIEYIPGRENKLLSRIGITINKKRDDLIDILKKSQFEKV